MLPRSKAEKNIRKVFRDASRWRYSAPAGRPEPVCETGTMRKEDRPCDMTATYCTVPQGSGKAICSSAPLGAPITNAPSAPCTRMCGFPSARMRKSPGRSPLAARYARNQVKRIFLADGDALVLPTEKLLKILAVLYRTFPNLQRVTSYAGPRDILRKSDEDMVRLREAGLKMLYFAWKPGTIPSWPGSKRGHGGRSRCRRPEGGPLRHEAVHDGDRRTGRKGGQ